MTEEVRKILLIVIFPEFYDLIDMSFYYNYNFILVEHTAERIEDILQINNIQLEDNDFGNVCDIILDFIILLRTL